VSDVDSLADRLDYVLSNFPEAEAIGKRAKEHVKEHNNWRTIARQYHNLYLSIGNKHRQE